MKRSTTAGKKSQTVTLSRFTFALIISTANRLNAGASNQLIEKLGVGVEAWRVLAIIAAFNEEISAQQVCQIAGMNKGAVSRTFKSMEAKKLIILRVKEGDGRFKLASLTAKGKKMHDLIIGLQLEREKIFLSDLNVKEVDLFIDFLTRAKAKLTDVDAAADAYVKKHWRAQKRID